MFARLIGSAPSHERSVRITGTSFVLHASLIGLAIHFAGHRATPSAPDSAPDVLIYVPRDAAPPTIDRGWSPGTPVCDCQGLPEPTLPPKIDLPGEISTTLPEAGAGMLDGDGQPGSRTGGDVQRPGVSPIVEDPARPLPGNPRPVYPSLLRNAHVEGVIAAHFVVDSTGRVEPRSITFESGGDALFESAVRRALLASRYEPARTSGRAVAMRVEQEFAFRITP